MFVNICQVSSHVNKDIPNRYIITEQNKHLPMKKKTKGKNHEENKTSSAPNYYSTHHLLLPVELWRGCCQRPSVPGRCSSLRLLAARPWWSDLRWVRRRSGCWVVVAGWETAGSAQTNNKEESGALSWAEIPVEVKLIVTMLWTWVELQ